MILHMRVSTMGRDATPGDGFRTDFVFFKQTEQLVWNTVVQQHARQSQSEVVLILSRGILT